LNQLKAVESIENRSASTDNSIEWSTVSKAALRSNKTKRETGGQISTLSNKFATKDAINYFSQMSFLSAGS